MVESTISSVKYTYSLSTHNTHPTTRSCFYAPKNTMCSIQEIKVLQYTHTTLNQQNQNFTQTSIQISTYRHSYKCLVRPIITNSTMPFNLIDNFEILYCQRIQSKHSNSHHTYTGLTSAFIM